MVQISERIQNLEESIFVKIASLAKKEKDAIGFNTGSPGHGCARNVREKINKVKTREISIYRTPHYGSEQGRKDAAKYFQQRYGLEFDPHRHINITTGFTHLFKCLCETILNPGDTAIFIEPTFPQYKQPVTLAGGKMVVIPTSEKEKWKPKPEAIRAALNNNTNAKMIVFNYPNNPSGATLTEPEWNEIIDVFIEAIASRTKEKKEIPLVLLDEAYVPLFHRGELHEHPTFGLTLQKRLKGATAEELALLEQLMTSCLIACTISKEGMAGVLLGMGASKNEKLIQALRIPQKASVITCSAIGEMALNAIIKPDPQGTMAWAGKLYESRLNQLGNGLNSIFAKHGIIGEKPVSFIPEAGMYLYSNFSNLKGCKVTREFLSKLEDVAEGKLHFESLYIDRQMQTNLEMSLWLLLSAKVSVVPMGRPEDCYIRFAVGMDRAIVETADLGVDREKTASLGEELIERAIVQIDGALSQLIK